MARCPTTTPNPRTGRGGEQRNHLQRPRPHLCHCAAASTVTAATAAPTAPPPPRPSPPPALLRVGPQVVRTHSGAIVDSAAANGPFSRAQRQRPSCTATAVVRLPLAATVAPLVRRPPPPAMGGGLTDLVNGALLCRRHHQPVHGAGASPATPPPARSPPPAPTAALHPLPTDPATRWCDVDRRRSPPVTSPATWGTLKG